MFIQAPTTTWSVWFMAYVSPLILSFLAVVIPAAALYLKAKLDANHTIAVNAAAAAGTAAAAAQDAASAVAAHSVNATNQLNAIEDKVNGAMTAMTKKADDSTSALLAAKDQQIAALTGKPPIA